ncbi:MAG: BspA family leucine-rich repeat surface protein [Bacilli bacterium]|jgi:surface protein|nr:BspA family leucine-rich repeat surface protein [Bacilli bacterium]
MTTSHKNIWSKKRKRLAIVILGFVIILGSFIKISYALWQQILEQEDINTLTSSCFNITFEEATGSHINLESTFPIRDSEGERLTPYHFKIKNNCNAFVSYDVALEITNASTLKDEYLKTKLNEGQIKTLDLYNENTPFLKNTKKAYVLDSWYLKPGEEKEYDLRIWMDENVTQNMENSQNTIWEGLISLKANYLDRDPNITNPADLKVIRSIAYSDHEGMWAYKENISKIIIQNHLEKIPDAIATFDESSYDNGSVISYIVRNDDQTTYTAYLQSEGHLYLSENGANLFKDFAKVEVIEGLENLDTSRTTDMSFMFLGMSSLTSLDLSHFDTSKVTIMASMFSRLYNVTNLNISNLNTSNVTNMSYMFNDMHNLETLDVSNFDTSKVTTMNAMFRETRKIKNLNISHFITDETTDMSYMFQGVASLTSLDLANLNTQNVTNMEGMFSDNTQITTLDLSNFNTSQATKMTRMFYNCPKLTTIHYGQNFVYANEANITDMFENTIAPKPTHSSWEGKL